MHIRHMVIEGTPVSYRTCLHATIIAPVYIVLTNTTLKGKSSVCIYKVCGRYNFSWFYEKLGKWEQIEQKQWYGYAKASIFPLTLSPSHRILSFFVTCPSYRRRRNLGKIMMSIAIVQIHWHPFIYTLQRLLPRVFMSFSWVSLLKF